MYLVHARVFLYEYILDPKCIFFIHYDPRLIHVFEDASINTEKTNADQPNIVEGEKIGIHDDVQVEEFSVEECEVDNDGSIPLTIWRSGVRAASSIDDIMKEDDIVEEHNDDDIESDDQNISSDINVTDLETNFIDIEYDESEDEDDYNTTLVGWCRKNNIM